MPEPRKIDPQFVMRQVLSLLVDEIAIGRELITRDEAADRAHIFDMDELAALAKATGIDFQPWLDTMERYERDHAELEDDTDEERSRAFVSSPSLKSARELIEAARLAAAAGNTDEAERLMAAALVLLVEPAPPEPPPDN